MDTLMLGGCASFVVAALGTYFIGIWPYLVAADLFSARSVLGALGLSSACLLVWGGFVSRRTGLPGACGFFGGSMALGVFLYLRLDQITAVRGLPQYPNPDYPESWAIVLPVGLVLIALGIAVAFLPRSEFSREANSDSGTTPGNPSGSV